MPTSDARLAKVAPNKTWVSQRGKQEIVSSDIPHYENVPSNGSVCKIKDAFMVNPMAEADDGMDVGLKCPPEIRQKKFRGSLHFDTPSRLRDMPRNLLEVICEEIWHSMSQTSHPCCLDQPLCQMYVLILKICRRDRRVRHSLEGIVPNGMLLHALNAAGEDTRVRDIGGDGEVHEGDAVDAAARGAVVLLGLEDAEVEGSAAAQPFGTDALEAYVANVVVVAAIDGQQSEACCIITNDVAVVDAYASERLALGVTVVAMGADIDGVRHVGP